MIGEDREQGLGKIALPLMKVAQKNPLAIIPVTGQSKVRKEAVEAFRLVVEVLEHQPATLRADILLVSRTDQSGKDREIPADEPHLTRTRQLPLNMPGR